MRLRTQLALAFSLLALAPLLWVPFALAQLHRTLSRELDSRISDAVASAQAELDRTSLNVRRAVEELAEGPSLEELGQQLHTHSPPPELPGLGARWMRGRGLTVLSVLDRSGVTLTSGHLPARLGDADGALFALTTARGDEARPVQVELRDAGGVHPVPALVAARPLDYGDLRLWVVGGSLLDTAFAEHLSRLAHARVRILAGGREVAQAGAAEAPVQTRLLTLSPELALELSFSESTLREAEAGLIHALRWLSGLGLAVAVGLGLWVARRITRPVEALTEAVGQVAHGALGAVLPMQGSGEVRTLVMAFNRMTGELGVATSRLVASERIAAWQEIAKRLAHELKNPLTPIQMSLETLRAAHASGSPRFAELFEESAGPVLEEVERLRRTVDSFSRFARLPRPVLAELDVSELVAQVMAVHASPPRGITLTPQLEPGLRVRADRDQLVQVLVNLLRNAEEASPPGGAIVLRTRKHGVEVVVEVEDQGPGVKAEDRARILEPYFTTKEQGTGLGLAIAARILDEHGGQLEVAGEPGQGAVFRLALPGLTDAATTP